MKRNILFIATIFLTTIALFVVQHAAFLARYASLAAGVSASEIVATLWHGLTLDASVAGYVVAMPLIVALTATWLPAKWWRGVIGWYLVAVSALIALIFTGNLGLYEYWAFPLDASVMQYLATPKEAAASVTAWQFAGYALVAVACCALSVWCYRQVLRLFEPTAGATMRLGKRTLATSIFILLCGFAFLAIRGGVSVATANISKVYFSRKMFLNHAAVNPVFSMLASMAYDKGSHEYEFFDEPTRQQIFADAIGSDNSAPADTLLRTQRPNVVLILAESFGRSTVDEVIDGKAVAPAFQRLRHEGIYFDNLYANSFRTDRGMVAVLSGFPAQTRSSVMKNPAKSRRLTSIARSLQREGYATSFIYGGDPDFTNTASYLYGTGFESVIGQSDLHIDAPTAKWGYADDVMAEAFLQHIAQARAAGRPFFTMWLTLSSHEPFDVPTHRFDDPMLNSMAFADECIARVIDTLHNSPDWDNTLIIVVADHAYAYPYGIAGSAVARHRIPMLWTGGAITAPREVATYASQMDLAATLLAQMGIAHTDFPFSRDIFGTVPPRFAYYTFNNGFGVVDADSATVYDCTSARVISPDSTAAQQRAGKAILQTTYKIIEQL